jgi:hypothetical protein
MRTKNILLVVFLSFFSINSFAQGFFDYSFDRKYDIPVIHNTNDTLKLAWLGGLNRPQFSQIDLNMDGVLDLIVFEGEGDLLLPFINQGITDSASYIYAPEYAKYFPPINNWVQILDYNNDGKNDLFSYYGGGIRIYQNTSYGNNLKFTLKTPYHLLSYYYNGYVNLYVTSSDYPGIVDMDGDGDLDIITFQSLGTFVHYHKNLSMENFGNADSLDFELMHECWGYFAESEQSNLLSLGISCGYKSFEEVVEIASAEKHVGSTLTCLDMQNTGVQDLLLGDTDFPTLFLLENIGTPDSAYIGSQDTLFPSNDKQAYMSSMPLAFILDIDNDSINEMIVAPFDPGPDRGQKKDNVWLYENTGSNENYIFEHKTDAFLQSDMIDLGAGAFPVIYDFDKDGLEDLIIANHGVLDTFYYVLGFLECDYVSSIAFYKNVGTATNPAFMLVDDDVANISQQKLVAAVPCFGDLTGNGSDDMLIGDIDGNLHLYTNSAAPNQPLNLSLSQTNYQGIDVGHNSTPQLIDMNKDGLLDLIVGERYGTIFYYENTGTTTAPAFTYITDSLGKVSISNWVSAYRGYSAPHFFLDSVGNLALVVGTHQGYVLYYNNIENNLSGHFTLQDTIGYLLDSLHTYAKHGLRANPTIGDLNNDGYKDLLIGGYSGGLYYLEGIKPYPLQMGVKENTSYEDFHLKVYPNPTNNILTIENPFSKENIIFSIYDVSGKKYLEIESSKAKIEIQTRDFAEGFYFIKAVHSKGIANAKFIVVH